MKVKSSDTANPVRLAIGPTEEIRCFLSKATNDPHLSNQLRQSAVDLFRVPNVPYVPFRAIWMASHPSSRPDLIRFFYGTHFVFNSPKPREEEELKARLKKLEDLAERNAYKELVKDITPTKDVNEPFSSYKDQLGFGLHVALTMFTGYLLGYAGFRALFNHNPAMNAAGGVLGSVGGMVVETFLFIIRSFNLDSKQEVKSLFANSKLKKNQ